MLVPALESSEAEPVFGTQQTPGSLSLYIKSTPGFQSFVRTGSSSHLSEKESLNLGYGPCHKKSSLMRIFLYILEYSCLRLLGQILALSKAHSTLTMTSESTKYLILPEERKQHSTIQLHAKLGKKNLTKTEGTLLYSKVKKQNRTQTTSSDDIMENTFQLSLRSIMTSSCETRHSFNKTEKEEDLWLSIHPIPCTTQTWSNSLEFREPCFGNAEVKS